MNIHMNGVILQVGQPQLMYKSDGTPRLDKQGVQMYRQIVTMQHEFQRQDGTGFNKYVTFDVISNSTNKLISKLDFKPYEELEVALDIDSTMTDEGRWFNTIRCFACERERNRWHLPITQRVATMPSSFSPSATVPAASPAVSPSAGATAPSVASLSATPPSSPSFFPPADEPPF